MSPNQSPEAEKKEAVEKKFNIDDALNSSGFAEFLAEHPENSFSMENEDDVEKRFETFNMVKSVSEEIKDCYSENIEKEMGIKLDQKDLASIDTFLKDQAIKDPEKLKETKEQLVLAQKSWSQIRSLEKELATLGNAEELTTKLEGLRTENANLDTAKKYSGFFGKMKRGLNTAAWVIKGIPVAFEFPGVSDSYRDSFNEAGDVRKQENEAIESVNKKHGKDIDKEQITSLQGDIGKQIDTIEDVLTKIQDIEELKKISIKSFENLRGELLSGVSNIAELTASIKTKIAKQLEDLTKNGSIKSLDQAQERYESLREAKERTQTGVNPLETVNEDDMQNRIDAGLEKAASEQIMESVLRANLGSNTLTKLEKSLEPFLKREQLGSKKGKEAREFIQKSLTEVAENLGDTNEDKAKKIIIARIIIKMKS